MANGNNGQHNNGGMTFQDATWKLITSATLVLVTFTAGMIWNTSERLAIIEATMVTDQELAITIRNSVPAPWFREQVNRIDQNLQEHMKATQEEAHRQAPKGKQ